MDNKYGSDELLQESLSFNSVFEYIKNNIIGLLLLILVFFIIYFVDYINRINSALYSLPNPIPIPGIVNTNPLNITKNIKRKIKKS